MSRHAWIDASAGAAGDMLLGALLDAGADLDAVQRAVEAVMPATVRLRTEEVLRAGQRALHLRVELMAEDHPHRSWATISTLITEAGLAPRVRDRALAAFGALAAAEARVHGVGVDDVHFHEVGAWDSIADVVGVCAALEDLGVDTVSAGVLGVGSGRTRIAHGEVGIPVPAVVELTRGWRVRAGGTGELCTPTGAALVVALAERCEELPELIMETSGTGAGTKDVPDRANVTRVIIGARAADEKEYDEEERDEEERGVEHGVIIEANLDDLDPRLWPPTIDALLAAGAADAWLTPMIMKHGRPAQTLSVLAPTDRAESLTELIFNHTTTFGVRRYPVTRTVLDRSWIDVDIAGVAVSVKIAHRQGIIAQVTPEFRSVLAAATALRRTPVDVLAAAGAAADVAGLSPGNPLPH